MSRERRITQLLDSHLKPFYLAVENESHMHHVPEQSETHFKVVAVSDKFKNKSLLARHRQINSLLTDELNTGLHALTLHLYTVEEWEKRNKTAQDSPTCRGGHRHG
ncbi:MULTISPECIES: BolA family transcriptional regulator [unclassified Legionella]|uniref:BolA family protein n=1 Tax=unclassified Legionella TaxID=2622702 RepID=UPI0010548516|nr:MULTISPECIES: BolA/IbaG family iron-sulfur metabolism protein [unclassified Legionella]MDI9818142.1 BolA/IbaG family iron-sulfur metabolism protein [Legionella sp. PL877]